MAITINAVMMIFWFFFIRLSQPNLNHQTLKCCKGVSLFIFVGNSLWQVTQLDIMRCRHMDTIQPNDNSVSTKID